MDMRANTDIDRRMPLSVVRPFSRRHLHVEIDELESALMSLGALVDDALARAVAAVLERDALAAQAVIAADAALNRLQLRIREQSFHILLTQAPVARDLRNVLAVMQMGSELERMGDHCTHIAKETVALCGLPEELPMQARARIGELGQLCAAQLRDILSATLRRDAEAARRVAAADENVDAAYDAAVADLVEAMRLQPRSAPNATYLLFIARCLERIGDRVTNIAEDLVYLETGEIADLG
jgi:phosphate transport system protein